MHTTLLRIVKKNKKVSSDRHRGTNNECIKKYVNRVNRFQIFNVVLNKDLLAGNDERRRDITMTK